jgi:hypothetical protein
LNSSDGKRKRRIPHNVRGGAIYEFIHMYKNPFAWVREAIANVYDQAKHPDANGAKPIARIYVHRLRKEIWIVDALTGLKDIDDFTSVGAESADRSSGKVLGDRISSYEKIDSEIIGQKHFGKLSCMAACLDGKESTEYYSNNGRNGHYLHCDCDGWEPFEHDLPFQIIDRIDALPHPGLKVVITDVRDECLNINAIVKQASKYFAILLSKKKIQIFVYDVDKDNKEIEVHKPEGFETKGEETHSSLEMSKGGNVRVNLTPLDTPSFTHNIDVYNKEIWVCTRKVPYLVKGYENWDGHELVITRDDYKDNPEYLETMDRYYKPRYAPEFKPQKKRELGEKQKEMIVKVIEEVCTAIAKVDRKLLPSIFGFATPFGIEGTVLKNPKPTKDPKDWEETTVTYDNDCIIDGGLPIIPTGSGTKVIDGGGNKPPTGTFDPNGIYTGKIPKDPPTDPDEPKLVMPQIDFMDGEMGNLPTISARIIEEERRLEIVINANRPASSIFRKAQAIDRFREIFYDKFIAAIIKLKWEGNDLDGFDKVKDEIWNVLYREGNGIQEQTEQMMSNVAAKPKANQNQRK